MQTDREEHLLVLGIDPVDVVELGRGKQMRANTMMLEELGYDLPIQNLFLRFFDMKAEWEFPAQGNRDALRERIRRTVNAGFRGTEGAQELYVDPEGLSA